MYTGGTAFLEALSEGGVSYIFANLGSDHPAIVEGLAEAKVAGRAVPKLITCPNEMVALSAAHGCAQMMGRAQAVIVHVECGTQALAGAVHNAANGHAPVLIFAGASPFTQEGEMRGTRNEFIQWTQDVFDQRGIVRGYVKYNNEIRTARNVKQVVHRALQFAHSAPQGPVYLMSAREVMEEEISPVGSDTLDWEPVSPCAIPPSEVAALAEDLLRASNPLVVTSHLGRNPVAVAELVRLCRRLSIGVLESVPKCVNFPAGDPLYLGNFWNEPHQNPVLAKADLVLALDTEVPWIPIHNRPPKNARIYQIDVDPLKERMPLWYISAKRAFRADVGIALQQINQFLEKAVVDERAVEARRLNYARVYEARRGELERLEQPSRDRITPEYLTGRIRRRLGESAIFLVEGVTNSRAMFDHLGANRPGSILTSGGGSLGWNGGAAIGVKLAAPEKMVVALTGDGTYMFSVPSSVHWMARRYQTPFLQVIYNNRGWKAPKLSTLAVHPDGHASRMEDIGTSFDPSPDYAGIAAAAGGAFAQTVRHPNELDLALDNALNAVREERRCAVLDVWLPHL